MSTTDKSSAGESPAINATEIANAKTNKGPNPLKTAMKKGKKIPVQRAIKKKSAKIVPGDNSNLVSTEHLSEKKQSWICSTCAAKDIKTKFQNYKALKAHLRACPNKNQGGGKDRKIVRPAKKRKREVIDKSPVAALTAVSIPDKVPKCASSSSSSGKKSSSSSSSSAPIIPPVIPVKVPPIKNLDIGTVVDEYIYFGPDHTRKIANDYGLSHSTAKNNLTSDEALREIINIDVFRRVMRENEEMAKLVVSVHDVDKTTKKFVDFMFNKGKLSIQSIDGSWVGKVTTGKSSHCAILFDSEDYTPDRILAILQLQKLHKVYMLIPYFGEVISGVAGDDVIFNEQEGVLTTHRIGSTQIRQLSIDHKDYYYQNATATHQGFSIYWRPLCKTKSGHTLFVFSDAPMHTIPAPGQPAVGLVRRQITLDLVTKIDQFFNRYKNWFYTWLGLPLHLIDGEYKTVWSTVDYHVNNLTMKRRSSFQLSTATSELKQMVENDKHFQLYTRKYNDGANIAKIIEDTITYGLFARTHRDANIMKHHTLNHREDALNMYNSTKNVYGNIINPEVPKKRTAIYKMIGCSVLVFLGVKVILPFFMKHCMFKFFTMMQTKYGVRITPMFTFSEVWNKIFDQSRSYTDKLINYCSNRISFPNFKDTSKIVLQKIQDTPVTVKESVIHLKDNVASLPSNISSVKRDELPVSSLPFRLFIKTLEKIYSYPVLRPITNGIMSLCDFVIRGSVTNQLEVNQFITKEPELVAQRILDFNESYERVSTGLRTEWGNIMPLVCMVIPIYEELQKRLIARIQRFIFSKFGINLPFSVWKIVAGLSFGLNEVISNSITVPGYPCSVGKILMHMICHGLFTALPLSAGICTHVLWNYSIFQFAKIAISTARANNADKLMFTRSHLFLILYGGIFICAWLYTKIRPTPPPLTESLMMIRRRDEAYVEAYENYEEYNLAEFPRENAPTGITYLNGKTDTGLIPPPHSEDAKKLDIFKECYPDPKPALFPFVVCPAGFHAPQGIQMAVFALKTRNYMNYDLPDCKCGLFPKKFKSCPYYKRLYRWGFSLLTTDTHKSKIPQIRKQYNHQQWVSHFTQARKRVRAQQAMEHLQNNDYVPIHQKSAFLKSDEKLYPKTQIHDRNSHRGIKPRIVTAVDTTVIASTVLEVNKITEVFKKWFHGGIEDPEDYFCIPSMRGTIRVHFYYASGATAEDLDRWMAAALEFCLVKDSISIAIMGDDSYWVLNIGGIIKFMEIDFSYFDRTQMAHIMMLTYQLFEFLGLSQRVIFELMTMFLTKPTFSYRKESIRIRLEFVPHRDSGGSDTTNGNSGANSIVTTFVIYCIEDINSLKLIVEFYRRAGFVVKVKIYDTPYEGTFLKGMWYPGRDGKLYWGPLISQTLKFFTVMSPFEKIANTRDPEIAIRRTAWALSQGLGFVRNIPILGTYLNKLQELGLPYNTRDSLIDENKILRFTEFDLDIDLCLFYLSKRYGITREQIMELDAELTAITRLPWYNNNPAWLAIAGVDYG